MRTIAVSAVVESVNAFLRDNVNLKGVLIKGELSGVKYQRNGHCYFDLKDEHGLLACVMWRTVASKLDFQLEDGMAVLVQGSLGIYKEGGKLNLYVNDVQLDGIGALYVELEKRKARLAAEGLFAPERKKPKPAEIRSIAIVTGETTAALKDALKTIHDRWPVLQVKLFPAPVQGQDAAPKIVEALKKADESGSDAVLLIRGGGSFEDLFCFNDESIVRQLARMKTYTVTGIGHEIDTSLADYAADHRALTPTAAAQWVTPDQREVRHRLHTLTQQLVDRTQYRLQDAQARLAYLVASSPLSSPQTFVQSRADRLSLLVQKLHSGFENEFASAERKLDLLNVQLENGMSSQLMNQTTRLNNDMAMLYSVSPSVRVQKEKAVVDTRTLQLKNAMQALLVDQRSRLASQRQLLDALSWTRTLERGFSIVTHNGKIVSDASALHKEDLVDVQFASGRASARVEDVFNDTDSENSPRN
ncbi:exodeoxyribonuclease VII large subunit [Allobaculum mucilyticum]|uniref:exodeoxyribonuclease VII large subunit n=1 Tax=Allobaculum mucilyticum TaxID=2834459 RepID=UPI001E3A22FF|nr:exodeoxyribonuclease VII large subunit [Allobaculum mucilyticum]UNT96307.1 exodeoxyribonuclease VII large subunit [Allobaculum mucilyticum]